MQSKIPPPQRTVAILLTLGLLTLFPPLATDMYLSAIGDLAISMHTSRSSAELSLSLFFLGLCLGQWILGPLIDSYGRKTPLLIGVGLFCVTSIALVLVKDILAFNTLRVVQAIGACSGMVVSRAIVNDIYDDIDAAKIMTVLVMILTIGPIISPTVGSLLLEAYGWRSIFIFMILIGIVAFVLAYIIIQETLPAASRVPHPFKTAKGAAKKLLTNPEFIVPTLISGLVQGGLFAFITGSSGVFQGVFGLSSMQYGFAFAGIAIALLVFGKINTWLLNIFSPSQILKQALLAYLATTFFVLCASTTEFLILLIIPLWFSVGLIGLISANAMSMAMSSTRTSLGTASAVLGAIQFSLAFIVSTSVALAGTHSSTPMALGFFIPSFLAAIIFKFNNKQTVSTLPESMSS